MVVRAGLAHVIGAAPDLAIVGAADSGEEALLLCQRLRPDVVLMDVRMAGMGGVGATEVITRYHAPARVVALSTFADGETVERMRAAGAVGFVPKTISGDDLVAVIRRVHAGETIIDAAALAGGSDTPAEEGATPPQAGMAATLPLAGQQRRVLALLTKGYTNAEIATYLGISLPTARYHVSAILLKLGVSNRAEAAALAVREALIDGADF